MGKANMNNVEFAYGNLIIGLFFLGFGALSSYYFNPQRNELKLEKDLFEEFRKQKSQIDSTYNAKKDSLIGWYNAEIDSLNKDYQTRKNLESLAK